MGGGGGGYETMHRLTPLRPHVHNDLARIVVLLPRISYVWEHGSRRKWRQYFTEVMV